MNKQKLDSMMNSSIASALIMDRWLRATCACQMPDAECQTWCLIGRDGCGTLLLSTVLRLCFVPSLSQP